MKTINESATRTLTGTQIGLGLVTVAFVAGLVTPVPATADVKWGSTYLNPDGTMAVCVCDGGTACTPCLS